MRQLRRLSPSKKGDIFCTGASRLLEQKRREPARYNANLY